MFLPSGALWNKYLDTQAEYYQNCDGFPNSSQWIVPTVPQNFVPTTGSFGCAQTNYCVTFGGPVCDTVDTDCSNPDKPQGSFIIGFVDGLSAELARVFCQLCIAIREADPCTAVVTIPEKAEQAGLTDCPVEWNLIGDCITPQEELLNYVWALRLCVREQLSMGKILNQATLNSVASIFDSELHLISAGDICSQSLDDFFLASGPVRVTSSPYSESTGDFCKSLEDIRLGYMQNGVFYDCRDDCDTMGISSRLSPICDKVLQEFILRICPKQGIVLVEDCFHPPIGTRPESTVYGDFQSCLSFRNKNALTEAFLCVLREISPANFRYCVEPCCPPPCE
jgi:hypothetical protein